MNEVKQFFALSEIGSLVKTRLRPILERGNVILLEGQLGSGKTTLVRAMCCELGVVSDVTSPTFGYVNTYEGDGIRIHHFDLYRLAGSEEFEVQGFTEYLHDSRALVVIEWSAAVCDLIASQERLAKRTFFIKLEHCFLRPEIRFISVGTFFKS